MGENPPLSGDEIMAIAVQRMRLLSGLGLGQVTLTAEFLGDCPPES
jgi:hypothetical protein